MNILVTGAAGFIGAHLGSELIRDGHNCTFIDKLTPYYSIELKRMRFQELVGAPLIEMDLNDESLINLFEERKFDCIVHLAAQPGVRVKYPQNLAYLEDNIEAFSKLARLASQFNVKRFIYASSSSVYENSTILPYTESELLLQPSNPYPLSKWINEQIGTFLNKVSNTEFVGLRFFSVYGPWGRPDMAYLRLISAALNKTSFKLNGDGSVKRDFTYIDDVVHRIVNLIQNKNSLPGILNIGGGNEVSISDLVNLVEVSTASKIEIEIRSSDKLDIPLTRASRELIDEYSGIQNFTPIETGVQRTTQWFIDASKQHDTYKWFPSSL